MEDLSAFLQQAKDRKQALENKTSQPASCPGAGQIDRAKTLILGEWGWHTLQIRVMGEIYLGEMISRYQFTQDCLGFLLWI